MPCAKLLTSIPPALVPHLQGFELKGTFTADVGAKIDFADLDALALTGKVGIDGCKVVKAPPEVLALDGKQPGKQSLVVNVEVPRKFGAEAPRKSAASGTVEPDVMSVVIGPDNPDFVPYDEISPYLVGSIMTTEDNGFFKHRGWVSSQFASALRKNLQRGGFRLGASSITMQMTKNVLLTREKTLSRKLQELFLVWYIEQNLSKERILELYFNAIEFGPRIYGIGAATRHYFGKPPVGADPAGGRVLLVDPAQPEATLCPVLPRRTGGAVGQVHPPHLQQGARARPRDRRRIRGVRDSDADVRSQGGDVHGEAVPRVGEGDVAAQDRARGAARHGRGGRRGRGRVHGQAAAPAVHQRGPADGAAPDGAGKTPAAARRRDARAGSRLRRRRARSRSPRGRNREGGD